MGCFAPRYVDLVYVECFADEGVEALTLLIDATEEWFYGPNAMSEALAWLKWHGCPTWTAFKARA